MSTRRNIRRRDFVLGGGAAAAAALLPDLAVGANPPAVEYHLHPSYREPSPLAPVLAKRSAANDTFAAEQDHDKLAAILSRWREDWLESPPNVRALAASLAPDFRGCSLHPPASTTLHRAPFLEVDRCQFPPDATLGATPFLDGLARYFADFFRLETADFEITGIDSSARRVETAVRFELVGSGPTFFREQRIAHWRLAWQFDGQNNFLLLRWTASEELRSRSTTQFFADMAAHAFGANPSYGAQLLHGVDYWRTVLDGACGIDLYGHNGVSVGDIDDDGHEDVYICQPAGLPNRLFRNRGAGTFEDITAGSGLGLLENTACAIFADFDNDGRQDLLVVRANGPLLFHKAGDGRFRLQPDAFRFANAPQGTFTGAAVADYDRDGWLDIYFCLYVYYQGTDQYKYPTPYFDANNGPPNFLLRNGRDGTFHDVTAEAGLTQNNSRYSFCCGWTDVNGDGWPDLYVVNDFGRKNLYLNKGGKFADVAEETGVADVGAGMSVAWFDYNRDGAPDLYVANMWTAAGERITAEPEFKASSSPAVRALLHKHAMGNSLFENDGAGHFNDRTVAAKVGLGRWAWSSDAFDFNHNGSPGLYVTNGMISGPIREDMNSFFWRQVVANSPDDSQPSPAYEQAWNAINELIRQDYSWSGYERNIFYLNNGDGTFSDVSGAVGLDFRDDARAFALADFNGDGRLELLVKNRTGPQLRLLQNVVDPLPPVLSFRLRGTKSNRDAIGAIVTLHTSEGRQTRYLQAGSGFLSQHTKELFFGLGAARGAIDATVQWPSGLRQTVRNLPPNHRILLEEGTEGHRAEPFHTFSQPASRTEAPAVEELPLDVETWLLAPLAAPDFSLPAPDGTMQSLSGRRGEPVLLHLSHNTASDLPRLEKLSGHVRVLALQVGAETGSHGHAGKVSILQASDDTAAVYNLLYRWLFDRHRDLCLPTSFLIDAGGAIVKIYRGPIEPARVAEDLRRIPASLAERLNKALPFEGDTATFAFARNYLSLGSTYFGRGYYKESEAAFRVAVEENPASAEAHYGLGSCYLKRDDVAAAQANFEQAVKLPPAYPETQPNAWNNLGLLATREGKPDRAIACFEKALELDPEHLISLTNLGNALRGEKRWEDSEGVLERALHLAPDDAEVNYGLGMVFAQTDRTEKAAEYLRRALALRPAYPEAMNNLGVLYLRTQRRDQAVAEFEASIKIAPGFEGAYLNLARVYLIEGEREKARVTLLALLKQNPKQAQAQGLLEQLK